MVAFLRSLPGASPHVLLEAAAYFVAARTYWSVARTQPRPACATDRWLLVACAIAGALSPPLGDAERAMAEARYLKRRAVAGQ